MHLSIEFLEISLLFGGEQWIIIMNSLLKKIHYIESFISSRKETSGAEPAHVSVRRLEILIEY